MHNVRVAIVGAGLAGLYAAYVLEKKASKIMSFLRRGTFLVGVLRLPSTLRVNLRCRVRASTWGLPGSGLPSRPIWHSWWMSSG